MYFSCRLYIDIYDDLDQNIKDKMDELNISYENISLNELFLSMNRKDVALYE